MAEAGCLRDTHVQNLEVSGNSIIGNNSSSTKIDSHLVSVGSRKFQTFVGTLASTNAASSAYADGDVLIELGTLDTSLSSSFVTGTKFFIHKAVVLITTAAGQTLVGSLQLSATSGTATNSSISSGTEIVGAGVTAVDPLGSTAVVDVGATAENQDNVQGVNATELDVNFNATAGNAHVFTPNVTAAVASKHLYACATTTVNADVTAGRFTVELEYSVL